MIYTGIPCHDGDTYLEKKGRVATGTLCQAFNQLWCEALNSQPRPERFAMIHADIEVEDGWQEKLDGLLGGADIISVIVPIRNASKLVSTAKVNKRTRMLRTLSMKECHVGPETFEGDTDDWLFVNTGCWLCDFTKPWVEEWAFGEENKIIKRDGLYYPKVYSEDYGFSFWANKRGLRIKATRAISLKHRGISNQVVPDGEPEDRSGPWDPQENFWDKVKVMDNGALKETYMNQMQALDTQIKDLKATIYKCEGGIELCRGFLAALQKQENEEADKKKAAESIMAGRNGELVEAVEN